MFNKYYQCFQKLIMNSLKVEINESVCQYEQKHCLSGPQFVSSLNVITDSNRFYQPRRTSKLQKKKMQFAKILSKICRASSNAICLHCRVLKPHVQVEDYLQAPPTNLDPCQISYKQTHLSMSLSSKRRAVMIV